MTTLYGSTRAHRALRALLWRSGRLLYCLARGDGTNAPTTNGEYWLLDRFLTRHDGELVIFDVGANKGDWTCQAFRAASRGGARLRVHAFEPCAATRSLLEEHLAAEASRNRLINPAAVTIHACALSSSVGKADFYSSEAGGATSSLSAVSGQHRESVEMTTLDAFIAEAGIEHIDMLKIDTEGFDFEVLKGGARALSNGVVDVVQFEYNWRWLINHASLRDVFEYIGDKPYRFGKLVGASIEVFDEWHFELDRYFENNYVLIRNGSRLLDIACRARFDRNNAVRRAGACST